MTFKHNQTVTILLVNQSQESCESLVQVLAPEGYNCVVASDSESAIRFCQKQTPNLIIANSELGTVTAAQFSQTIRGMDLPADIPMIFLTDTVSPEHALKAKQVGAELFGIKPFNSEAFLELNGFIPNNSAPTCFALSACSGETVSVRKIIGMSAGRSIPRIV